MKDLIRNALPAECPWRDTLHWFLTTDSTNTQCKLLAKNGAPGGTAVIASYQSAGRGRVGRSFYSPDGKGLYLSVLLRPDCPLEQLMHLTCAAAVATCKGIAAATGFHPSIKWTNDLIAQGKKLGGILTEIQINAATGCVDYAIIGIGINCSQKTSDFPADLQNTAISLECVTKTPKISQLAAEIIQQIWEISKQLAKNKDQILADYRERCITLSKEVLVTQGGKTYHATALDVDGDGGLVVRLDDGTQKTIRSGEASIRSPQGYL